MRTSLFLVALLLIFSITSNAQQVQHSGWLASFNTFKINSKFSAHFDAQFRSTNNLNQFSTILIRPGLNYHINKSLVATAGYAFIPNRRTVGTVSNLLTEHRIWEQLVYSHKVNALAVSHRLRFEQRFIPTPVVTGNELEDGPDNKAYRLRYFIRNIFPLVKQPQFKQGLFLALQNEVFANVGNKTAVNGKFFDQNRLYGAIGYRLPGKIDLEAGYMNQYTSTRTSFVNNHIAQLAVYKRL